jgi:uncharacterized protein YcfJ
MPAADPAALPGSGARVVGHGTGTGTGSATGTVAGAAAGAAAGAGARNIDTDAAADQARED